MNDKKMSAKKKKLRKECFNYLKLYHNKIKTKLDNICGKTGSYTVPDELFQKRTHRKNRVLISWNSVKNNNLDMNKLNTFKNGIVVEFINDDFFDEENKKNPLFIELKKRLGSDENVSSIISFRTADGDPGSQKAREAFLKFTNNSEIEYKNSKIIINQRNYKKYRIVKNCSGTGSGIGNDKWKGFLFVSIRGAQHDTIETHKNDHMTLFNPACEYANDEVCLDIDLTLAYFAMHSVNNDDIKKLEQSIPDANKKHIAVLAELEEVLGQTRYELDGNNITLLDYCKIHPSLAMGNGELIDPIQIERIPILNFGITNAVKPESINITHNEAVRNEKYYWDKERKCVLSPARPTNLFWSFHLSNMMQQEFNLNGYIEHEEELYKRRRKFRNLFKLTEKT